MGSGNSMAGVVASRPMTQSLEGKGLHYHIKLRVDFDRQGRLESLR